MVNNGSLIHQKGIDKIAEILIKEGFNVYKLNTTIPDLICSETPIIPIEFQKDYVNEKIEKLLKSSSFSEILILTSSKKYSKRKTAFLLANELRKREYSYRTIEKSIFQELGLKISDSTLSDWFNKRCKKYNKLLEC